MSHSEFDVVKNFSFIVNGVKNKTYEKDGDLYVKKVILETDNHQIPKEKVTINPSVTDIEVGKKKQDGTVYEYETEKDRDPTILELDAKFPKIKQLFTAVNNKGSVKLKGMVRTVRDNPDDEWNFFIKPSEMDNLKASIPEDEQKAEKVSEDSEDSTAEEFVENQTNIDVEDEDQDEKVVDGSHPNEILFGGDEDDK